MKNAKQSPEEFCKIVSKFTGEPIDKLGQIVQWKLHGTELYELCSFYFSCVYTRFSLDEIRRQENQIYRLKGIIVALIVVIVLLIIK